MDDFKKLRRFLLLSSENGIYDPTKKISTSSNTAIRETVDALISNHKGTDVVTEVINVINKGLAANKCSVIYVLAVCARSSDVKTKQAAYAILSDVCPTADNLFTFVNFTQDLSALPEPPVAYDEDSDSLGIASLTLERKKRRPTGWGRAHRNAISKWYNAKDPKVLAETVTKYQRRGGWSHIDLLRLSHTKPANNGTAVVLKYIMKGLEEAKAAFGNRDDVKHILNYLEAVYSARHSKDETIVAKLVEEHHLSQEQVSTELLKSKEVLGALMRTMPLPYTLSRLGQMTSLGMFEPTSENLKLVKEKLNDSAVVHESRMHPLSVLSSWKIYEQGKQCSDREEKWAPNLFIQEALNSTFKNSFKNLTSTKRKHLLAISIRSIFALRKLKGAPAISPAVAVATMALATSRIDTSEVLIFSDEARVVQVSNNMELMDFWHKLSEESSEIAIADTDVSLPLTWATKNKKKFDAIVIYTDAKSTAGDIQPVDALKVYREKVNAGAKLVICGIGCNAFGNTITVGDGSDPRILNIHNFDMSAPSAYHTFIDNDL